MEVTVGAAGPAAPTVIDAVLLSFDVTLPSVWGPFHARLAVIVDGPPALTPVYPNLIVRHSLALNGLVLLNRIVLPTMLTTSHPSLDIGAIEVPTNRDGNVT
jgi:hypothetical protein